MDPPAGRWWTGTAKENPSPLSHMTEGRLLIGPKYEREVVSWHVNHRTKKTNPEKRNPDVALVVRDQSINVLMVAGWHRYL